MSKKLRIQLAVGLFFTAFAFMLWQNTTTSATVGKHHETRIGKLVVNWIDPVLESSVQPQMLFFLLEENGTELIPLKVSAAEIAKSGGLARLQNRKIKVTFNGLLERASNGMSTAAVESVEALDPNFDEAASTAQVLGNKKFVNILCRFPDSSSEPAQASFYDEMFRETYPGLGHFWRDLSYNQMNVEGSVSVGWYVLPHAKAYYLTNGAFDNQKFAGDCTQAADAAIYFPDFFGINFILNEDLRPGAAGEAIDNYPSSLDNTPRTYGATWIYLNGSTTQAVVAHEMGHTFGLQHSSGGHGNPYDSYWDLMSNSYTTGCNPQICNPNFGFIGQHTISPYKDHLGWIPETYRFTAPMSGAATIDLSPLASGPAEGSYLMAKIPINGTNEFYSVEVREKTGYDQNLPGQAVIIHKYNGLSVSAVVMDADSNNNPNDAGAQWTPGETFEDTQNRIRVTINSAGFGIYNITVEKNIGCRFNISSTGASFPGTGGNGAVEVDTESDCYWELSGAAPYRQFNADGFEVNDAPPRSSQVGLAGSYPSTVTVGSFSTPVTKARVRIKNLNHASPGDIDMILVAPNGTASMIMSDASGSLNAFGSSLVFDQFADTQLNQSGTNPSGTYLPTDYGSVNDIFPVPGPGIGLFAANLDLFNGMTGNGNWKLFVVDDTNGGTGNLAEWGLDLASTPVVSETMSGFGPATVNYTVTTNYGRPRVLTFSVSGQTFTISQL